MNPVYSDFPYDKPQTLIRTLRFIGWEEAKQAATDMVLAARALGVPKEILSDVPSELESILHQAFFDNIEQGIDANPSHRWRLMAEEALAQRLKEELRFEY